MILWIHRHIKRGICCFIPSRKPTKLCHYTGDRGRGRTTLTNEYTYIHTHTHREHSSWKSCKVETPRFGITSGAKVAAGKGGVLSICPFSSPFFRYTPIRIKAKEGENERDNSPSRRDAIWQIVGHRNCRVRGASRTRRPLSENQRAIRGRRRAVFFSLLASILVSMDIISSHRRIMPRHTRVCPRETKEEASFCFHGHHGMRASSCASLIFARAPWLSFLFLLVLSCHEKGFDGLKS